MKSFASIAFAAALIFTPAFAQDAAPASTEKVWHHGISLMGELKYPEDFKQLDYVNPDAPKGGTVRLAGFGSFDTFNPILDKGEAAPTAGFVYESLLTHTLDETSTAYGLVAEALSYPADFSSATFRLDPDAKWWDGQPITPEDVIWSFDKARELNKFMSSYYANVEKAEQTGDREVTFTFKQTGNRELPLIVGEFPILPKHWWEGTDANGKQRNIGASTLELPMGSGPYRLDSFNAGTSVTYRRVEDYWAANKPTEIGTNNFDTVRYEYFRDLAVAFEAFKADQFDYWTENQAKRWATAYDFPAANDGRVVRERFAEPMADNGAMVGFVYNLRKPQFQDERVRRALNYAFDFEQLQKTLFYGEYKRVNSFFFRTELAAPDGPPQGEELDILNSVKDLIPAEVFTTRYANPIGGAENLRKNLGEAVKLLDEAGYVLNGSTRMTPDGRPFTIEILLDGPTIEPVAESLVTNLGRIGIQATIRSADSAQYQDRLRTRDFDITYTAWGQTLSPGNEQLDFWGSVAADTPSSRNYSGIKDPGIDALIDKVIYADDRETLIAATHALDRVLLAHQIIIPSYAAVDERVARWDRFGRPEKLPAYSVGFPTIWWWDEAKAAKVGG
ncbi:MAG TPA: extracellular solute-binding protein [Devosia sp.]